MNVNQFAAIAVRLYGLHLLFAAIIEAEQTVNVNSGTYAELTVHDFLPVLLLAAIAFFLLLQTDLIVRFITRDSRPTVLPSVNTQQLAAAAFSLAGVVILVSGLASLAGVAVFVLAPATDLRPTVPGDALVSSAAIALVKCLFGVWLFAGSRQVLGLIKRLRPMASQPPSADA